MSTRCGIGKVQEDGTIKSVYSHSDGYLEYVGKLLVENYYGSKLDELLDNGSISLLGPEIGVQHIFQNPFVYGTQQYQDHDAIYGNMTRFYARDRGEDLSFHITQTEQDYARLIREYGADYMYLHKDGKWHVLQGDTFVDLEDKLHANKISFSKRIGVDPIEGSVATPLLDDPDTALSVA